MTKKTTKIDKGQTKPRGGVEPSSSDKSVYVTSPSDPKHPAGTDAIVITSTEPRRETLRS